MLKNHRSILTKTTGHICPLNKSLKKDIREEDKIREESRTHFSLSNNNVCKNAKLENEELPVEDNSELTTTALSNTATSATFAALISQSSQIDMEKHMTFVPTASDDAWLSSMDWDDLDTGLSSAVTESPAPTDAFTESFDNAFTDSYDHAFPEVVEVRSESITDNSLNANTPALGPKPTPPVDESKKDILSAAKSVVTETVVAKSVVAKSDAAARKLAEAEATQLRKAERAAVAEEKRVAAAAAKAVREAEATKRGMASRNAIRILCDAMSAAGNPTPDVGGWQPAQRTKLGYLLTTWGEAKYSRATNLFATGERGRRANWYIGKFLFEAADFWETEPFTPAFRAGGANSGVVNGSVVNGAGVKRNGKLPAPVEPTTYYNLDDVTATDFGIPDICNLKYLIRTQGHATYYPPQGAARRPDSAIRLQQSSHVVSGLLEYQAQDESYH